jgi:hypothetical protein
MLDMLGGILGAGAGIAGSLINAEEQAETREQNWEIAMLNYNQRERERSEAIAMANKLRAEQKLGFSDMRGTRTKFVPGKGWVVTGAPELLEMMKLQDKEQRNVLTKDLPMRRQVMERNYKRGLQEEALADTFRRQLVTQRQTPARSDEAYASDLYNAMAGGLREASADAGGRVFTQAMRTGQNSNFDDIAGALQAENNKAYANAALQSRLMSRGLGEKERAEKTTQLANLYNLFATRAGALPEVNYRPQAIDDKGQATEAARNALVAGQDLTKMFAMKGGELDYLSPLTGVGNAIAGGGAALGSALSAMGSKGAYNNARGGGGGITGFGATGGGANTGYYIDEERGG